jgi:hypothetical protein
MVQVDGMMVDALTIATHDLALTVVARLAILDDNDLLWLAKALRANAAAEPQDSAMPLLALANACDIEHACEYRQDRRQISK